ncbi:hypothetical protein PFISCL1PPCAC_6248 [Pristionchus fissidentatus]|uniref:Integrator complex subunit 7 n=1 Tax=Pristionchus fissidentatus TaxID=1538716 RepID=A0AAV5V6F0_9BILA|nr:hypothetical protein PFISCL1PPCAC_6248 [Pristionchus fissidentatus]
MDGFSYIIQQFDRGIQSRLISEQLATVVNTVSLVKKNPFPNLVNSMVVRLSEHFVSGPNSLRGAIARSLSQMEEQLLLVFSHNEVCRRLLVVSHSNDPIARAHTLFALSSIAVIAKENKEVHTFVVDSLSSSHKEEFNGACSALAAFCRLSTEFTRTVLAQISEYLLSSTSPIERKIQIVSIFSHIQSDQESSHSIFALGAKLFELNTDLTFLSTLLSSLTSLAILTRFSILDQLSLLLSVLSSTVDCSPPLSFVALSNISRLANHAHVWTKEHISRLGEYRHRLTHDEDVCCALLHTLEVLGRRRLPSHMGVLQEILSEMSPLYSHDSLKIRASFIAFSTHVFVSSPSDLHRQNLLNSISSSLSVPLPTKIGVKISKVAGVFLTNDAVSDEEGLLLVSSLCKLPLSHSNVTLFLHLFCLLSQKRRAFVPPISKWARDAIQTPSSSSLSPSQLSFLAFPPFAAEKEVDVSPFNKLPYTILFEIVRSGFRNGHWRSISMPLLKSMTKLSLSCGTRDYLVALSQLAQSQSRKCTVSDVQSSVALLALSKRSFIKLSRSSLNPLQSFCYRYVEALEKTRQAQMQLMSTLTVFVSFPSPDGPPLSIRPISFRIFEVLQSCLPILSQSISEWSLLLRRSFDGDDHSIDLISLEMYSASILVYGVKCIMESDAPNLPLLPPLSSDSVIINETRSLLLWAASSMQQLAGRQGIVTTKTLDHFFSVFRHMYTRPVFIPRLFFQPTRRTTIKLSVSPGAEGELTVSPSIPVPIRLDGVISTSRKTKIEAIIVSANIHYYSARGRDRVEVRRVETHDGNFFTAQFLLKFEESAQMDISVELVDGEKRKTWLSDASTTLRVDVNM